MPPQEAAPLQPHRFSRAEYDRMVELGALEDLPVELLDGVIVHVTPQGGEHAGVVQVLMTLLTAAVAEMRVRVQAPMVVGDRSEPEPDLVVLERPDARAHPSTAALVIEVVVSSEREARYKAAIYAQADVTEYWIVRVRDRTVEVLTRPGPDGYAVSEVRSGDDVLAPPTVDTRFTVAEVFAPVNRVPS